MKRKITYEELRSKIYGIGCNSFNRMQIALTLLEDPDHEIADEDYWKILRLAYECSDNIRRQVGYCCLYNAFTTGRDYRECMMTAEELQVYNGLPEVVTIYRGMNKAEDEDGLYGVSWTLSEERANFFTNYFRNGVNDGIVVRKEVPRRDVVAYFNERKENEIIYIPRM